MVLSLNWYPVNWFSQQIKDTVTWTWDQPHGALTCIFLTLTHWSLRCEVFDAMNRDVVLKILKFWKYYSQLWTGISPCLSSFWGGESWPTGEVNNYLENRWYVISWQWKKKFLSWYTIFLAVCRQRSRLDGFKAASASLLPHLCWGQRKVWKQKVQIVNEFVEVK